MRIGHRGGRLGSGESFEASDSISSDSMPPESMTSDSVRSDLDWLAEWICECPGRFSTTNARAIPKTSDKVSLPRSCWWNETSGSRSARERQMTKPAEIASPHPNTVDLSLNWVTPS